MAMLSLSRFLLLGGAKSVGAGLGFDAAKYEVEAVSRGQRYWAKTVRELTMG